MSLGKLSDDGNLGEEFKDLTLAEIKTKLEETFYKAYGRYENVSGKMWIELYHNGDADDHTKGSVVWKKGTIGQIELDEDEILEREKAILRFIRLMQKGYSLVFQAVTKEDMDKHNALRVTAQSNAQREGWLGIYYKGKSFFRINEYSKGQFYIERGYDGTVSETSVESEGGAKFELDIALTQGYHREGEDADEYVNPLEAFGYEVEDTIESVEQKAKPVEGEMPDSFFEMMGN